MRRFFLFICLMNFPGYIEILYQAFLNGAPICTDSRTLSRGCIFFALKGPYFNGNTFATDAIEHGAALAVIDERITDHPQLLKVDNALTALQQLALYHRMQLNIPFIAITGSNGKTTTKELINRVLLKKYKTLCTSGNLNNHIGVPLTLLSVTNNHEVAVIEMGANHLKEIELLCSLALPGYVLITNIGKAHLEGFGGIEGVKKGKGEMYEFAKKNQSLIFINDNDTILNQMLGDYKNVFRYGTGNSCDVQGVQEQSDSYVNMKWKTHDETGWHQIQSKITGGYNFGNILSAIAVGVQFGVNKQDISSAIETYIPDNQRSQEIFKGSNRIIMDAYNANPTSMEAALKNFNESFKSNRAVFLGDMLELGSESLQEHSNIINSLQPYGFDLILLVGENFSNATNDNTMKIFKTSAEAASWIKSHQLQNYHILIKGSRGSKMELLLEAL